MACLVFFLLFEIFSSSFFSRDGNRGRARAVKSGSTELREIRTAGVLFFFFRREGGGGDDDDDDFELFEKFARSFLEEKRSLAEGVFTSAFVSLLTMCLCRPWRLCFSSLFLSLLSSFFCSPYSSSLMFALSSRRHHYYRNRCICDKRKASSLYWKYGTRTI